MTGKPCLIWTEGKTDWQHLKRAFTLLGAGGRVEFKQISEDFGDDQLYRQCVNESREMRPRPTIFVFDRDREEVIGKVNDANLPYKAWGNNVFSFAIPVPQHRSPHSGVCIELYYTDEELSARDSKGRRLYLSNEFNNRSGRHTTIPSLSTGNIRRLQNVSEKRVLIIDSEVYNDSNQNVALTKADFAQLVVEGHGEFSEHGFIQFQPILEIIDRIVDDSTPQTNLAFEGLDSFISNLNSAEPSELFEEVAKAAVRMCKLACSIFASCTVRYYDQRIRSEDRAEARRIRPIRELLAQHFSQPSLQTYQRLAFLATHLLDENSPTELHTLRNMLTATPILGPVGEVLDCLDQCFPKPRSQARTVNKNLLRKPLLDFVISEFARHESHLKDIRHSELAYETINSRNPDKWMSSLLYLRDWFEQVNSLHYCNKLVQRGRNENDELDILLTTYHNGRESVQYTRQQIQDLDIGRETYEVLLNRDALATSIDLYPFNMIKAGKIYFFNRVKVGTPPGYEFISPFSLSSQFEETQRKFSHLALRSRANDQQSLFWAHVEPTENSKGVRANIPLQEPIVGRRAQIDLITEDVITIPNENAIVYGPGGVGKTALLIELTKQLFDDQIREPLFRNIIWISAKQDYYDPLRGEVEIGAPRFTSIDNVLTAIIEFHGWEDPEGYSTAEKKWLAVEFFREAPTLLIIDNFESIGSSDKDEITRFFGTEVKRELKDKPAHFKVIITSREMIPSGFHQVSLRGLDRKESQELMERLYQPYVHSGRAQLTVQQMDALYEATSGIPLVMRHCYGQIYEFNGEPERVVRSLAHAGSKIMEYSFSEILALLKKDTLQLRLLIVLEISGRPITAEHVADLLSSDQHDLDIRLNRLIAFHCVVRLSVGQDYKYTIADEAVVFARRLVREHDDIASSLKREIASLSEEARMDYSREEQESAAAFRHYVDTGRYLPAEDYIKDRLRAHPDSVVLVLEYAKYLTEVKRRSPEAIDRLQAVLRRSGNDPQVLRQLLACYLALDSPHYEEAQLYAKELELVAGKTTSVLIELARFYTSWSTAVRLIPNDLDPNREMLRQQRYKELADVAIGVMSGLAVYTPERYYLTAQCYLNKWEYGQAMRNAESALRHLPAGSHLRSPYERLKSEIEKKQGFYTQHKN